MELFYLFGFQITLTLVVKSTWAAVPIPGEHFYTTSLAEANNAASKLGYIRERDAGYIFHSSRTGLEPLFRLNNPGLSRHFYTTSTYERDKLFQGGGWTSEGTCGYLYPSQSPSTLPLYRLYKGNVFDHLYTTSSAEVISAEKAGYTLENIQGYLPLDSADGAVPFLRLFRKCKEGQDPNSML
jgi:hypothetical protein